MALYEENKETIEQDAGTLCLSRLLIDFKITMGEISGNYYSEEAKDKAYSKPFLDKGISSEWANELSAATYLRQTIDSKIKEGNSLTSKESCLHEILPKECSDIAKIGLELKYFPERKNDYMKMQAGVNECSYIL